MEKRQRLKRILEIIDLHAEVDGKKILKGINLKVNPGEVQQLWVRTDRAKARSRRCWRGGNHAVLPRGKFFTKEKTYS